MLQNALKEWQANRPGDYQSSYQERIDQLLNQLLQRESFQYSYTKDPLYRQYEQNYLQNAHNASADAAAQAAALTGGYGSSYATSAAQQAYQQQIGALSSAIPTLYSLALDTYTSGGNELVSQLDQLNNSEQDAQQQYNNKLSDYYTQLQQKGEAYNNAYAQDYGTVSGLSEPAGHAARLLQRTGTAAGSTPPAGVQQCDDRAGCAGRCGADRSQRHHGSLAPC